MRDSSRDRNLKLIILIDFTWLQQKMAWTRVEVVLCSFPHWIVTDQTPEVITQEKLG